MAFTQFLDIGPMPRYGSLLKAAGERPPILMLLRQAPVAPISPVVVLDSDIVRSVIVGRRLDKDNIGDGLDPMNRTWLDMSDHPGREVEALIRAFLGLTKDEDRL